jgi:hypothetical protein
MWALEVKGKSDEFADYRNIMSDIFFKFPTGRKWVFGIGDFRVRRRSIREPPFGENVAQGPLSGLAALPSRRGLGAAARAF